MANTEEEKMENFDNMSSYFHECANEIENQIKYIERMNALCNKFYRTRTSLTLTKPNGIVKKKKFGEKIRLFLKKNNRTARKLAKLYGESYYRLLDIYLDMCELVRLMEQVGDPQLLPLNFNMGFTNPDPSETPINYYEKVVKGVTTVFPLCEEIFTRTKIHYNNLTSMNYKTITMNSLAFIRNELQWLEPHVKVLFDSIEKFGIMHAILDFMISQPSAQADATI